MYEFASGVINVLEKKIFDALDQERMLTSPDKKSAFEVLFDTDMGDIATKEKSIERIIEMDLTDFKKTLADILKKDNTIFWLLFLRYDALNLKSVLKKIQNPESFSYGLVPFEKLSQKVSGLRVEVNPLVERMINKALIDVREGMDSKAIETIVDKVYFEVKLETVTKIGGFILDITKMEIDIANVKAVIKSKDNPVFIKGGNFKKEELEKLVQLKEGEILQDLKKFFEVFGLSLLIEKYSGEENQTVLENALTGFVSQRVFDASRETSCGIAKILAFFYKKMNSYVNIRLIMFSKENNISTAEIEPILLPI